MALALSAPLQAQIAYITNPDNTLTITSYTNTNGIVVIPASINGQAVTVFGNGSEVFVNSDTITNVTLPGSLISIGDYAFEDCYYLTNVTLANGLISIGYYAFEGCYDLASVNVPNTVTSIDEGAFYECESLHSINIPEGVTTIQEETFYYCTNLSNPHFPESLTSIGEEAFEECYGLKNLVLGPNITEIGEDAFYECGMTNLVIGTNGPTPYGSCSIGEDAFESCTNMANVLIGCSVTSIAEDAFYECVMTNLVIGTNGHSPYGGCAIGYYAFYDCSGLTNVTIGTSVTSIGYDAFYDLYSTNVTIGANGHSLNGPCALGYEAFYESSMTNLTIGNNVTVIDDYAFEDCYCLSNLVIGDSSCCPNGGCYIGYYAFQGCPMLNAWLGNNVTAIDYEAFYQCEKLLNLWIGTNVSGIGQYAFYYCYNLTNAYIGGGNLAEDVFDDCYVLTNLVFGPNVKSIGYDAFDSCGMNNLVIPDNVSSIQEYAFEDCPYLTNVTIGNGVTGIPYGAFEYCYALRTVTFGANVGGIQEYAFYDCTNLTTLYFHGNAPGVDSYAFQDDKTNSMTAYYLPGTTGWRSTLDGIPTALLGAANSLQVMLEPDAVRTTGATWQLDGASYAPLPMTTVYNLTPGSHTVTFTAVPGWVTPASKTLTIAGIGNNSVVGIYVPATPPASGLTLLTNGPGTIKQSGLPNSLVNGKKYKVTAVPSSNSLFVYWQGGVSAPYTNVVSKNADYTFTMQSGLVLIANFAPNPFLAGAGSYSGLFSASNVVSEDMAGMIKLDITSKGAYTGKVFIDGQSHSIAGAFTPYGQASTAVARSSGAGGPLLLDLTLSTWPDLSSVVSGAVYGTNHGTPWAADNLIADQATNVVPSSAYTMLVLPDANNAPPTNSPGGDSYLLITNSAGSARKPGAGGAKITGGLADGTTFSQSTHASADGYVPVYANLYSNKGLVMGWINLVSSNAAGVGLTWIHPPETKGIYKSGFTNVASGLDIMISPWTNPPPGIAGPGNLTLLETIGGETNGAPLAVTTTSSGAISGTGVTGSIDLKTGYLKVTIGSGSSKVTGYGAILLNATNGGGYYLTNNTGQALELTP
jgi:hypothetical protein